MYLKNDTAYDIVKLFPEKPIEVFESSGLDHGMVLKFNKGYFKIYPVHPGGTFNIKRYHYHSNIPISDDNVKYSDIREYLRNLH